MKLWDYLENQFLNCTDNSMRKAVKIAQKHDSSLFSEKANPLILPIYNFFHPLYLDFNGKFDILDALEGAREGSTLNIRQKLRLLSNPTIRLWEKAIGNVFDENSPEFKALLPNGRKPFQRGAQLLRINAVNTLALAIGDIVLLQALKTEVLDFYNDINEDYTDHQADNSEIANAADNAELARIAMCNGMYKDLADLMAIHYQDPAQVEKYFPLDLIRNAQQVDFTNSVGPQKLRFIVKRTLNPDHQVTLINDGNTELWFYLAPNKTTQPGATKVALAQHTQQTVAVTALGNPTDAHFIVYNPETEQAGHFTLELM